MEDYGDRELSQFRAHFRPTVADRIRTRLSRVSGAQLGQGVIVQAGARIERFPNCVEIGEEVIVKVNARICACNSESRIKIGARTTVGAYSFIYSSELIQVGEDCLIAPFAYIVDSNHSIDRSKLISQQNNATKPIRIGNDVWIGAKATILPGSDIADGCVIAANSTFRAITKPYEIWGGTMAKKIGERS